MTEAESHRPVLDIQALSQLDPKEVANTPEFQAWAGDDWQEDGDVVTDAEGVPVVFYHGGNSGVEVFNREDPLHTGPEQHGYYFSERLAVAKYFSDNLLTDQAQEGVESPKASVYAVFLKGKNPLVAGKGSSFNSYRINELPEGHDMVVNPKHSETIVFDPSQIFIAAEAPKSLHR